MNFQSLFCGILFCISITALIIACLAFAKGKGGGEYFEAPPTPGPKPPTTPTPLYIYVTWPTIVTPPSAKWTFYPQNSGFPLPNKLWKTYVNGIWAPLGAATSAGSGGYKGPFMVKGIPTFSSPAWVAMNNQEEVAVFAKGFLDPCYAVAGAACTACQGKCPPPQPDPSGPPVVPVVCCPPKWTVLHWPADGGQMVGGEQWWIGNDPAGISITYDAPPPPPLSIYVTWPAVGADAQQWTFYPQRTGFPLPDFSLVGSSNPYPYGIWAPAGITPRAYPPTPGTPVDAAGFYTGPFIQMNNAWDLPLLSPSSPTPQHEYKCGPDARTGQCEPLVCVECCFSGLPPSSAPLCQKCVSEKCNPPPWTPPNPNVKVWWAMNKQEAVALYDRGLSGGSVSPSSASSCNVCHNDIGCCPPKSGWLVGNDPAGISITYLAHSPPPIRK